MRVVSRFEAKLLRILHFFLQRVPAEQALPLVTEVCARPRCLSRAAVEAVQDALAKGPVQLLAKAGGWRPDRFLRGDGAAEGRLWQRTPPRELALSFSGHTLRFLLWMTAEKPAAKPAWGARDDELTAGDRLVFFLAYQALRATEVGPALAALAPFSRHGLCWLAWPEDFVAVAKARPDFAPWTSGVGAAILEAWQTRLARHVVDTERGKGRLTDWRAMQALGKAQGQALTAFLDAVDTAGCRDLAGFLLRAAANLLTGDAGPSLWVGGLTNAGPRLADRSATHAAALTFLRQLDRLRAWETQARGVGYFDDGYGAAQYWLAEMERWHGPELCARAQEIIRLVDPLRQT